MQARKLNEPAVGFLVSFLNTSGLKLAGKNQSMKQLSQKKYTVIFREL